jgi:nucleoside-diphosphate-sugar epimerase
MIKLYCTGGTGTIGKHLPKEVERIKFDLSSDEVAFKRLVFESQSNVLHLAGVVGVPQVLRNGNYARLVNIEGTRFLARQFKEKSKGIFYFVSTSHVYAPTPNLISELSPLAPANIYAEQKLEAETVLLDTFEAEPHRLCIIRVFSVLDWDSEVYTLGGAIKKLTERNTNFILSNCSDVRDFLTPKSIAKALYEIVSDSLQLGIVNLCSGQGISVGAAAKKMLVENGYEAEEHMFSWGHGTNPFVVGDNSWLLAHDLNLDLAWKPSSWS